MYDDDASHQSPARINTMLNVGQSLTDREEQIVDELDDNTSVETVLSAPPEALDPVEVSAVTVSTVSIVTQCR